MAMLPIPTTYTSYTQAQEHFLYGFMRYFGVSENLINKAQEELDEQKKVLEEKNYFSKYDKEDEDD